MLTEAGPRVGWTATTPEEDRMRTITWFTMKPMGGFGDAARARGYAAATSNRSADHGCLIDTAVRPRGSCGGSTG